MPQMNMVQAINDGLRLEMQRDTASSCSGEDVGKVGGVFRVTQGLFDEFGDDRVIDTPLRKAASSAPPSGWPSTASCPSPRFSSPISSSPPTTRS